MEHFIQKLYLKNIKHCSHLDGLEIPLDDKERKHLLITGKNGSGKTSTLEEINTLLTKLINNGFQTLTKNKKNFDTFVNAIENSEKAMKDGREQIVKLEEQKTLPKWSGELTKIENKIKMNLQNIKSHEDNIESYQKQISTLQKQIDDFINVNIVFSGSDEVYKDIIEGKFILKYFQIGRNTKKLIEPKTPTKDQLKKIASTTEKLNEKFLQYILNLKTSQAFAVIKKDNEKVQKIEQWFERFETNLKDIFEQDDLVLEFLDEDYKFNIKYDNKEFGLNELSDGYSSFLAVVTELILRMEAHDVASYDMQGVVLIDEIETHLHVELQKKVLPFLISFFPKLQFIVTTHSPFVLQSLDNAVICDLENGFVGDSSRFTNASYDQIVKNYFQVDTAFSKVLEKDIKEYESLVEIFESNNISEDDEKKLLDLDIKLDKISPMLSDEIYLRFKESQDKIQDND